MSLQTLWDVITTSTGVDHGCHHLNVDNVGELSWFLKVVETLGFNHLSGDFIGDLKIEIKNPNKCYC